MSNKSISQKITDADYEATKQSYEAGRQSVLNEVNEVELKLDSARWVYEMAGKIKATHFAQRQSEFLTLIMLKQVKETKEYRLKYGMTWVDFCEYVGLKQRNVDLQLEDLEPFRFQFLATFADFMGADISKIKYLGKAISAKIADFDGENIIIGEDKIPCIPERAGEINAILDQLQEELKIQKEETVAQKKAFERVQTDTHKTLTKLEKELDKFKGKAAELGITPDEAQFMKKMEFLKKAFDGYMLQIEQAGMNALAFDADPQPTKRMIAEYLSALSYMKMQILSAYDVAADTYGDPSMLPEESLQTE
jgi:hypothetical protein